MSLPRRGLYAITSAAICRNLDTLLRAVSQAIEGGTVIVQYRDKLNDAATRQHQAQCVQALCRDAGVLFILNDGPAAAVAEAGFDGMHLGDSDGAVAEARQCCPGAVIGATCGQSLERALLAQAAGASYVAFGAFHPSSTKPLALRATPALLVEARRRLHLPICAIGGITPENAAPLIAAGADYLAAVEGIFGAPDVTAAARAYARLFV